MTIDTSKGFTLTRELDATPEQIWNAWTVPDEMAEWWHPRDLHTPREAVDADLRVGGAYRYTMVDEAGETHPSGGVYREVTPTEKLVFTWGDPSVDPDDNPIVSVGIRSLGELTRVTLEVQGVDGNRGDQYFYDGWDQALDGLVQHLGQTDVFG